VIGHRVQIEGGVDLAEVAETGDAAGGFARFAERWQEDGDQQRDDADDDEQLDEGKAAAAVSGGK
jgi:hypothetical protein